MRDVKSMWQMLWNESLMYFDNLFIIQDVYFTESRKVNQL